MKANLSIKIRKMINKLSKKNFKMLCCEKSSKDISAKFFYAKHGFVEFGKIKNYWESGGDLILLVKYLCKQS